MVACALFPEACGLCAPACDFLAVACAFLGAGGGTGLVIDGRRPVLLEGCSDILKWSSGRKKYSLFPISRCGELW